MATIDGLTAERMQEIINGMMASASVDPTTHHLILTLHDGTALDLGNVQGPAGAAGADGSGGITAAVASYYCQTGVSLTSSPTTLSTYDIVLDTAVFTPTGGFTLASGLIVIPADGLYHVCGQIEVNGISDITHGFAQASIIQHKLVDFDRNINGQGQDVIKSTTNPYVGLVVAADIKALAGDSVSLHLSYQLEGHIDGNTSVADNHLSIHRVG